MEFTSNCSCTECVISRWFPMGIQNTEYLHIDEKSDLRETWGEDLAIGLLPQASVWFPSHSDASELLPETPETPNTPPNAVPTCQSPETFSPGATLLPQGENFFERIQHIKRIPGLLPLQRIAVRIPASNSAKRQKRKQLDSQQAAPAPSNRLHISNIPFHFRGIHLTGLFQGCGTPRDAEVIFNERGSKGFGFVTFKTVTEATMIKELFNGTEVDGRVIEVNYAAKKTRKPNNRLKVMKPDDAFGRRQPAPDAEVTHRADADQVVQTNKYRQRLRNVDTRAHPYGKTGQNAQILVPSVKSPMNFARPSRKVAAPKGEGAARNRVLPRTAKNTNQDVKVIQLLKRDKDFEVQNCVNEHIEALGQKRQFKGEVADKNQIADNRRKIPTGDQPGLPERQKTPPNKLQSAFAKQNLEVSKMSDDKENKPPGVIGGHLRRKIIDPPRPEPTWFLNLNFSLSAPLEFTQNLKF